MHNTNALQHVKALASRLCHSSGPPLSAQHQGGVTCAHHQHWETVPCRRQSLHLHAILSLLHALPRLPHVTV